MLCFIGLVMFFIMMLLLVFVSVELLLELLIGDRDGVITEHELCECFLREVRVEYSHVVHWMFESADRAFLREM